MDHTPGPWLTGDNPPQPLYRGIICILEHNPEKFVPVWVINNDGRPVVDTETNAALIALAPTAPHPCDPECPGDQNRRKLEAAEGLLEAAKQVNRIYSIGGWNNVGQTFEGFRAAIANYEEACQEAQPQEG